MTLRSYCIWRCRVELDGSYRCELQVWFLVGPGHGSFASPGSCGLCCSAALGTDSEPPGLWEQQAGATPAWGPLQAQLLLQHPGVEQPGDISGDLGHGAPFPWEQSWAPAQRHRRGGMGDVGQAPRPLRFLPAQPSVQPTPALGRFTEQQ